jgi:hypothetical protein
VDEEEEEERGVKIWHRVGVCERVGTLMTLVSMLYAVGQSRCHSTVYSVMDVSIGIMQTVIKLTTTSTASSAAIIKTRRCYGTAGNVLPLTRTCQR